MTRRTFITAALFALLPGRLTAQEWRCTYTKGPSTAYCTNGAEEISAIWYEPKRLRCTWRGCKWA